MNIPNDVSDTGINKLVDESELPKAEEREVYVVVGTNVLMNSIDAYEVFDTEEEAETWAATPGNDWFADRLYVLQARDRTHR